MAYHACHAQRPLEAAYNLSECEVEGTLSYRDRGGTTPLEEALKHITFMDPKYDNSTNSLPWMVKIGEQMDMGWTTAYSDGTGRGNKTAAASVSHRPQPTHPRTPHKPPVPRQLSDSRGRRDLESRPPAVSPHPSG